MSTEKPPAETLPIGVSVFSNRLNRVLTFQTGSLPRHFLPFYAVFSVLQSLVIVYFTSHKLWAEFTGDHSTDRRMLGIFVPLITVFVTIQMTLSLLHPTRRWLSVLFAALLAFLLFVQTTTVIAH
jgi:hypothetical protein